MTNLFYSDEELAQINEALFLEETNSLHEDDTRVTLCEVIDLHCHGFKIEVYIDDNTLLCNDGFVFSDPDIAKVYIVLGKHLEGVGK